MTAKHEIEHQFEPWELLLMRSGIIRLLASRSTIDCPPLQKCVPLQKYDLIPSIRAGLASNKCGRPMEDILHVLSRY
jgi:hypothetical protein